MILIVSSEADTHALAVHQQLTLLGDQQCQIVGVDELLSGASLEVRQGNGAGSAKLTTKTGQFPIAELRTIWWRRTIAAQGTSDVENYRKTQALSALLGTLDTYFSGRWVSNPYATHRATNKVLQLQVAIDCGFCVPRTRVCQSKAELAAFVDEVGGPVIAKPLASVVRPMVFTRQLPPLDDIDEGAIQSCPTIYQELVPGIRHMRLVVFGELAFAAVIETEDLDWRANLNVPVSKVEVPEQVSARAKAVLRALDLEMGVFDLKQTPAGDWVWLEVNPQGQFLFLEPLTGMPLARKFAGYLASL